ncbi:PQQ-like beta-propeller repeat protein [Candidatus Pelagibacter sp.]|nr:PQQ-like beta-propeller repeat protein [Candidatus Pelagibacter sp.]
MNKRLLYILIFIFITSCSLSKKDNEIKDGSINIFEKIEPIKKELNTDLKIKSLINFKNKPFQNNKTNSNGNINFDTNFTKISNYKFSKIKKFEFYQPELFFTNSDEIIFFNGKGTIFKLNQNLKEIWKINNYNKKEKKLNPILYFAQINNKLIVNDNLSKIYSVDLNTGKILWSRYSNSSFNSNIKVFQDKFYTIDFDNVIRAISSKNGNEVWNFQTENSFIKSEKKLSIIIKDEIIFFVNNLGDVTALDVNNGSLVWQTPTQTNTIYQNAFSLENSDLVFENNTIYFSNNKNEFFSIDARTGTVKWVQSINSSLRPTIIENLIFTVSNEGYLFIIDDPTGNIVRITDVLKNFKDKLKIKPIGFIHAKNKVYVSLNNGRLVTINSSTGIQENVTKINNSKISRPYILNNSMYLIKDNGLAKIE